MTISSWMRQRFGHTAHEVHGDWRYFLTTLHAVLVADELTPDSLLMRLHERASKAPHPDSIAALLGLTPAEAAVTAALCSGESLAGYATRRGLSRHTVRTLLRNAMAKTGTHRQAELVSLVLSAVWRQSDPPPQ